VSKKLFSKLLEFADPVLQWIEFASRAIEILAVIIIVVTVFYATARFIYQVAFKIETPGYRYSGYKRYLGRTLLLGLEILVAADIIRTVALESSLTSVVVLGLLVLVRTFLSWSLVVELEGRWPWQPKSIAE
jgi:uncharacterized membrane protein